MFGHYTYLILELGWALPIILIQVVLGLHVLRVHWRVWLGAALLAPLYLSCADDLAIHAGIWRIDPTQTIGVRPLGLPVEEALFFLLTNLMVVQTIIIICAPERRRTLRALLARHKPH